MTVDGPDTSVEAEVWKLFEADDSVSDDTVYLVAAALQGDEELVDQLGSDQPMSQRPESEPPAQVTPLRAFLRSITVEGFRGIGPSATLELRPYCGLTVVSGRNGSGKSSFAEAMEYALTGASYRFSKKSKHWRDSWRNLHDTGGAAVRVEFAMEPDDERAGTTATIGVDWAADAELDDAQRWAQIKGQKKTGIEALGWEQALLTHRPLMSYDELGGLLEDAPSTLYDALNRLLGLDEIADADRRLKDAERRLGLRRKAANDARTQLVRQLDAAADPRADQIKKLIARKPYDLEAVSAIVLGTTTDQAAAIARLRTIAEVVVPDPATAAGVANELRAAIDANVSGTDAAVKALTARATLLREALHLHQNIAGGPCPVCETGTLDQQWYDAAVGRLQELDAGTAEHQAVTQRLVRAREAAESFFGKVSAVPAVDGVELVALSLFDDALTQAQARTESLSDLPTHLESAAVKLADAAELLREEAAQRAGELEDAWAPVARAVAAWVDQESAARTDDDRLGKVTTAVKWLRTNAETLRARRIAPVVTQAQDIWRQMRHESNVDLGGISLEGTATRRKAVVEGTVDGVPAGALSVMSQGELHALALALFIPRATTPASPFRFIVLDDPIQAMDPAKINGFLDVLLELAQTRQVIVFSHDDRLPAAIRARSLPAQLLDVTREPGSVVMVKENDSPAHRYIADAEAVIRDDNLDDTVKRKATPGLFRMAVEAAAHQRFFTDQARAGANYQQSEQVWENTKKTRQRVALALTGDADGDISGWSVYRQHRRPTLDICGSGVHTGAALGDGAIADLRRTVLDIIADR
ncbi:AAA family ATPase [[Mycobacterium] kokjensenii]|uniref:Nuclease SbcCD subunit C n=1 Tax=[Mycobacterium] kokjensenii TaxID=3064287 RepID=A0ABN9MZF3_9MYCO|nr:AAA family ATPase [Mycolicibacter sp. MU0083]CAJ1497788.1 AAA family ATPase [Mycolicibacter sp. MU0083]